MECKFLCKYRLFLYRIELIETLWNVNDKTVIEKKIDSEELIETLWNVNKDYPNPYIE